MKDMTMIVLSDSMFSTRREGAPEWSSLKDAGESFQVCKCVSACCSLMMPWGFTGKWWRASLLNLARRVMECRDVQSQNLLADDPHMRVIVVNAAGGSGDCREPNGEQFPQFVADRKRSSVINPLETPWTLLDFEDVIQQKTHRQRFNALEPCRLRNPSGLFGKRDPLHFRADVADAAQVEVLKALRRTAIDIHGESIKNGGVVLVIAAGGNCEGTTYGSLDREGKAWRRAELLAAAELCALDGHPMSSFLKKIEELRAWRRGSHSRLLRKSVAAVKAKRVVKSKGRSFRAVRKLITASKTSRKQQARQMAVKTSWGGA